MVEKVIIKKMNTINKVNNLFYVIFYSSCEILFCFIGIAKFKNQSNIKILTIY